MTADTIEAEAALLSAYIPERRLNKTRLVTLCHTTRYQREKHKYTHTQRELQRNSNKAEFMKGECLHGDSVEMQRQQNGPSHFARE